MIKVQLENIQEAVILKNIVEQLYINSLVDALHQHLLFCVFTPEE